MIDKLSRSELIEQEDLPAYKNSKLPVIEEGNINLNNLKLHLKHSSGQIARLSDTDGGQNAREMAELANTLQKFFVEETRLGIPVIFHGERLHGLTAKDATSYPQPIGLASTFNPELIEQIFDIDCYPNLIQLVKEGKLKVSI